MFANNAVSTDFKVTSTLDDGSNTNDASYTFTIVLSDPCRTATINSPSISTITFDEGTSTTQNFVDASDSFGAAYFNTDACGERTYAIQK